MRKITKLTAYTMDGNRPNEVIHLFVALEKDDEDWSLELVDSDGKLLHIPFEPIKALEEQIENAEQEKDNPRSL